MLYFFKYDFSTLLNGMQIKHPSTAPGMTVVFVRIVYKRDFPTPNTVWGYQSKLDIAYYFKTRIK